MEKWKSFFDIKKSPKLAIHCWIFITSVLLVAVLAFFRERVPNEIPDYDTITGLLWLFAGIALTSFAVALTEAFSKTPIYKCSNEKLTTLGIIKTYASFNCEEYIADLLRDFDDLEDKHTKNGTPEPIKVIAVGLTFCLSDASKIASKIKEVMKAKENCHFHFCFCHSQNYELMWRKEQAEKLGLPDEATNQEHILTDIKHSQDFLKHLKDTHSKQVAFAQYKKASPFATIFMINDHIYYTPNLFRLINWIPEDSNLKDIRPSFLVTQNSPFGKQIGELLSKIYTIENLSAEDTP